MVKIAILDDSDQDRSRMEKITNQYFAGNGKTCEITLFSESGPLIYELKHKQYYDLFLLDVEMGETSGLETARDIRMIYMEPIIIYVTNHVEYAIDAYEVNAFRYIPKIMLEEKLPRAYDALLPRLDLIDRRIYEAKTEGKIEKILYRNIYYIRKDKKDIVIVHREGETRERNTLQKIFETLHSEEFIYIDKGCIVNILHVLNCRQGEIRMRDESILTVSRPRKREVKEMIFTYWRERKA